MPEPSEPLDSAHPAVRSSGGDESTDVRVSLGPDAPIDVAGAAVRAAAVGAGLGPERSTRVRATVEELIGEARARDAVAGAATIEVHVAQRGPRLRIEVRDTRVPLVPGASRRLASRRLAALGFVDRLHIASDGVDGNLAACDVDLAAGPGGDDSVDALAGTRRLSNDVDRVGDDEAAALVVRALEPGDEAGVARCVYRCYGYTYLDPLLYRPALLRRAVRAGVLHPVVAVTPDGEVVGHCALSLDRRGDPVPEGGKLVVDPRYRGHHLAERLAAERARIALSLGVAGIWFECVTNHPASQREVLAGGGVETGLLVGATPAAIHMEALHNTSAGRHALLAMWTPVRPGPAQSLHVAPQHVELVEELVATSGLARSVVGSAVDAVPHARSRLTTSVSSGTGVAHLRVERVGVDLADRIADELDGVEALDAVVEHVDLCLGDPVAPVAVDALERLGFSFGAWLPEFAAGGDVLRLQRVADHHLVLDDIAVARPEGARVRDAVLEDRRRVRMIHRRGDGRHGEM